MIRSRHILRPMLINSIMSCGKHLIKHDTIGAYQQDIYILTDSK